MRALRQACPETVVERLFELTAPVHRNSRGITRWLNKAQRCLSPHAYNVLCTATSSGAFRRVVSKLDPSTLEDGLIAMAEIDFKTPQWGGYLWNIEALAEKLPGYSKEMLRQKAEKSEKRGSSLLKAFTEDNFFDPARYPLLARALSLDKISRSAFLYQRGTRAYVDNTEFDLIELFLERGQDVVLDILNLAARRTTFDKNITKYLAFLLELESYLLKHTGDTYTCVPRLVDSSASLEGAVEGTKRSKMTPTVHGQIVQVPYVHLAMSTGSAYTDSFYIIKQYQPHPELPGVPLNDTVKCNGLDDYGLCWYTISGSSNQQGRPTFLIIFERLSSGTRVHFHRVHPCRMQEGQKTFANNLIERCYTYMTAIPPGKVVVQQGDLVFVETAESNLERDLRPVNEYEGHHFDPPVYFAPSTTGPKQRMGYIQAMTTTITHGEHEHKALPRGFYEIYVCKTWEANPTTTMTYNAD